MKNLNLANVSNYQLGTDRKIEKFCVDSKSGEVYFYENGVISKIILRSGDEHILVDLIEYYQSKEKLPQLIGLNYLESSEAACVMFSNGDILLHSLSTNLQCVGVVSTGIKCYSWSPDEEIIALVTGEDHVIIMTSSFDLVNEVFLHEKNTGEKQFITVGWGKKETQFHGSEGKAAAKVIQQTYRPVFDWDDMQPRISWRGDGELFVVSTVNPETNIRQLRIFNREGVLQFTSELVDGLEAPVCWKPSGTLIASVQRLPNKYIVAFFEKNGLRHGDFTLPFAPDEMLVKYLSWNNDSTVLAVCCESLKSDSSRSGCLQLWTVGNYHWYLKKVISYEPYGKFMSFHWDINHANRLHLLCEDSTFACHNYTWTVDCSKGKTEEDSAYVAVVDGERLLMTPFRENVVPPPLSSYTIHMPMPVSDVVFAPSSTVHIAEELESPEEHSHTLRNFSNDFLVILNDNSIVVFAQCNDMIGEYNMNDGLNVRVTKVGENGYKNTTKYHCPVGRYILDWSTMTEEVLKHVKGRPVLHHWQWISEKMLFCCFSNGTDSCMCIMELTKASSDSDFAGKISVKSSLNLLGTIVVVNTCYEDGVASIFMQLQDGTLMKFDTSIGSMGPIFKSNGQIIDTLPVFVKMEVCSISGKNYIFGLTNKNRFYINDKEVLSDCSSFFVHSEYLLITTYRHQLLNIVLTEQCIEKFMARKSESDTFENKRRIERGSRIVVAVPKHSKVILQMPRGNLECIQPRALSLHIISDLVERRDYGKAFDLVRVQRINLNILCDLNPIGFMNHLKEFVTLVKNPNWLCLFLCELQSENIFESMYSGFSYLTANGENLVLGNKLKAICDGLREAMESINEYDYFLPILTSYVMKRNNDGLVSALKRVKLLKEGVHEKKYGVTVDEALKYLIYLVDVDALYDAALGIYDFDLVLMIAAKSSKDPKEYIPFINEMRKLENNYQHYKIDMHLKSYSFALKNIAKCGDEHFDECLHLVKSHKLYTEALKLFPKEGKFYKQICEAYADHLLEDRHYEEAGIMQKLSCNFEKAIDSFKKAGNWRQTLILAKEMNYKPSQMSKLCRDVVSELKERRKFAEAASILNEYLKDPEESVEALTSGCLWDEAMRIAHQYDRLDLIETHVKTGVKDHFDSLTSRLTDNKDLFVKYKTRLSVVRNEKLRVRQENEEKGNADNIIEEDLVSEASSVIGSAVGSSFHSSSRASSRSHRSSKNRRKHERKMSSLKEGNPHEEVALISALKDLYENTFSQEVKDEVRGLCIVLLLFGYEESATQLQNLLSSIQKEMVLNKHEIWPILNPEEQPQYGPFSTSNTISALASSHNLPKDHAIDLIHIPPNTKFDSPWKLNILK